MEVFPDPEGAAIMMSLFGETAIRKEREKLNGAVLIAYKF